MAESQKIESKEIIQENLFDNTTKSAKQLSDALTLLEIGFEDVIKAQAKILKNTKLDSVENIKKVTKAMKDQDVAIQGLTEAKEKQVALEAEEAAQRQLARKDFKDLVKLKKAELVLQDKTRGLLEKLNAANTVLRASREKLVKTDKDYEKQVKRINKAIDQNNAKIIENSDKLKKAKLNVGNYSAAIKDALGQTGLFNGTLGTIVNSLKNVADNFKKAETGAEKLRMTLKGIAAIGIVGIISGLVAVLKQSQGVIDAVTVGFYKLVDALTFGATSYAKAEESLQSYTLNIRKLRAELQLLILDEEDELQISQDNTLGYNKRNEALLKSIDLKKQINDKNVEIAQSEYDVALANVAAGAAIGAVNNATLDALAEADLKLKEARDEQQDYLTITEPQILRQRASEELVRDLELVRSKKKSSTAQIDILEKQINDEKLQIEEREKALKQFNKANRATFDEQIRLIKERTGIQFDAEVLLQERNNIALAEKIKNLQLGEEITSALATIIERSQDAEIKGLNDQAVLEEAKVQRLKTIERLQRDMAKARREDAINDIEVAQAQNNLEEDRARINAENNLLDRKKLDILKETMADEEVLINDLYQKKSENLKRQKEDDTKAAEASITDKQILAQELLKIEEQYNIDIENLEQEKKDKSAQIAQENLDILTSIEKKKSQMIASEMANITQAFATELDKRAQLQDDQFAKEQEKRKENIERQQELAAAGLENQLAFEQAQADKAELARKDAADKAAKQKEIAQLTEAYFNAYNARLSQEGSNPDSAAAQAFGDVLKVKGFSKAIVQFFNKGSENVQPAFGGQAIKGVDTIPAMLEAGEGVVITEANKKNPGVVGALNDGTFSDLYLPRTSLNETAKNINKTVVEIANNMLLKEYSKQTKILKEIADKPVQQVAVDEFGNLIETIYKSGIKEVIKHKTNLPRL